MEREYHEGRWRGRARLEWTHSFTALLLPLVTFRGRQGVRPGFLSGKAVRDLGCHRDTVGFPGKRRGAADCGTS